MHDDPDLPELLAGVRGFIEDELLDALADPRLRYRARVAAFVLAIAEREARAGEGDLREEARRLDELLGAAAGDDRDGASGKTAGELRSALARSNAELVRRLRDSSLRAEPGTPLWSHLRRITIERLRVSNPAYLARATGGAPGGDRAP